MQLDFWNGVTGDSKDAFIGEFDLIPEKTLALATVVTAKLIQEPGKDSFYEIKWKIIDGDYKNRQLFQKIRPWDKDDKKAIRAKNMLMLLFKLFQLEIGGVPSNDDLLSFNGNAAMIRIMQYQASATIKNAGNWVSQVLPSDYIPEEIVTGHIESAFTRNPMNTSTKLDDDLPI